MTEISFETFQEVEIRTGTILEARRNEKARKPAYILKIDFGEHGIKTSSAQITANYSAEDLVGRQIVAVMNFPSKLVAGVKSEVLVLGSVASETDIVLLTPTKPVANGLRIA